MPTLRNRERDSTDYRDPQQDDREISLGTGTILAIFFALALVCAVFFGLGYSMGRKSVQGSATVASVPPTGSILSSTKPSAGNSTGQQSQTMSARNTASAENYEAPSESPRDPDASIVTTVKQASEDGVVNTRQPAAARTAATSPVPVTPHQPKNVTAPILAPAPMPETSPNGTAMVQVAAVSHQEDADVLISALKKRGYAVFIRQEPQDHLLHVQVGPFASKKDADGMRQRLLADGYNAIVK